MAWVTDGKQVGLEGTLADSRPLTATEAKTILPKLGLKKADVDLFVKSLTSATSTVKK